MDQGHFLTGSGSKIPMPKSKKENIVPLKPKLTATAVKTTNYISDIPGEINVNVIDIKSQETKNPRTAGNCKCL